MVGRLVENEEVDVATHKHTKAQTALFAAGESTHAFENILSREEEMTQSVAGFLRGTAAVIDHSVIEGSLRIVKMNYLGEICGLDGGTFAYKAFISKLLSHNQLYEGGFARAVIAYKGNALFSLNEQLKVGKKCLFAESLTDSVNKQHLVAVKLL